MRISKVALLNFLLPTGWLLLHLNQNKGIHTQSLLLVAHMMSSKQYLTSWPKEQKSQGFKNCMICHLERMDSFMINMVFSGFSRGIKERSAVTKIQYCPCTP